MATYEVKTTGSGSGVGSDADPFTWAQLATETFANGDIINVHAGTHSATTTWSTSATIRLTGVRSGDRPVISGSLSSTVFDPNGTESIFEYLEFNTPNASRSIDYDVIFRPILLDIKGGYFDGRGGSRSGTAMRIESSERIDLGGDGNFYNCKSPILSTDSGVANSYTNCVVTEYAGNPSGVASPFVGSIFIDSSETDGAVRCDSAVVSNCIFIGNSNASKIDEFARFEGCFYFDNSTKHAGSGTIVEANATDMVADPFIDSSNFDLRFTTAAKSQAYYPELSAIMVQHVLGGTPGITTDSLADLLAGSGGDSGVYDVLNAGLIR